MKPDPMIKMLVRQAKRRRVAADRDDMAEMLYQPNEFTTSLPVATWRRQYDPQYAGD